jgi:hypothetical protein
MATDQAGPDRGTDDHLRRHPPGGLDRHVELGGIAASDCGYA